MAQFPIYVVNGKRVDNLAEVKAEEAKTAFEVDTKPEVDPEETKPEDAISNKAKSKKD